MGRTSSTIRVRLTALLNIILEIQQRKGHVTPKELTEKTSLTDRSIRDYLKILTTLGVLEYEGSGRYSVNQRRLYQVMMNNVLEPTPMITLEDFIDPVRVAELAHLGSINEKIKSILKRVDMDYLLSGKLRDELRNLRIDSELERWGFVGDKFILERRARDLFLDNVWFSGSASAYTLGNYRYRDIMTMSIVFLSAANYVGYFSRNVLDRDRSKSIIRPYLRTYKGKEPFLPGDPFYEMTSDFPELLESGRKIAARYLVEYQHLSADYEAIKEYGDKFRILFRNGSLVPHGFIVYSRHLMELRDRVHTLFKRLLELSRKKDVLLVGVSVVPHDNYIIRILNTVKRMKIGETSDLNLMLGILYDGEATCPVKRKTERGRPPISNWYEFYIKRHNFVLKVEMITDSPLEDQERVLDTLYSLSLPAPDRSVLSGPSIAGTAQILAKNNLMFLKRNIEMAIHGALRSYIEEYEIRRDRILFGEESDEG
ncbi:MAG: hypothetical protein ACTSSP_10605 [Candidatus Asgardarchaeia archaeon]